MAKVGWQTRRKNMVQVCRVCHTSTYVANFYEQYDALIELYNSKFAQPGVDLMALVYENGLLTETEFDEPVEWTWWEIWHHEGRVARHGASMMAPDYTHWHGLYEVAKHWYSKFIPELRELVEVSSRSGDPARVEGGRRLAAALDSLLARPEHAWFTGRVSREEAAERKRAQEEFRKRYSKE